ncbi:MAG: alpha-2-macroglobulin family protein [Bacteroidaceae bacterium]
MRKKMAVVSLVVCLQLFLGSAVAQTYRKMWKKVDQMDQKDRPTTALQLSQTIFKKAVKQHDVPQMMSAYLHAMYYRNKVTPDSFYVDVDKLEQWVATSEDAVESALLHAMLGEIYFSYLQQNYYKLSDRSITASSSIDMQTWSRFLLAQKGADHVEKVFSFLPELATVQLKDCPALVVVPPALTQATLLDFVGNRMVDLLLNVSLTSYQLSDSFPIYVGLLKQETFLTTDFFLLSSADYRTELFRCMQRLLRHYASQNDKEAYITLELKRLQFIHDVLVRKDRQLKEEAGSAYQAELRRLITTYAASDASLPVYAQWVELLMDTDKAKALQVTNQCIAKYKGAKQIVLLKNLQKKIVQPVLNVYITSALPGDSLLLRVRYKSLDRVKVTLRKVHLAANDKHLDFSSAQQKEQQEWVQKHATAYRESSFTLSGATDVRNVDTTFTLAPLPIGIYAVTVDPLVKGVKPSFDLLHVSNLKILYTAGVDTLSEVRVLDARTGHPIEGATVHITTSPNLKARGEEKTATVASFVSDKEGRVVYPNEPFTHRIYAAKGMDNALPFLRVYRYRYGQTEEENRVEERATIYTDRSIYRPGQVVHIAGWAYQQSVKGEKVVPNKRMQVRIKDSSYQLLATLQVTTNDFGSFSVDYPLPTVMLSGTHVIEVNGASQRFRVEEYKRPTYRVVLEEPTEKYETGDTVLIHGWAKRFSGAPLQQAKVKVEIQLNSSYTQRELPILLEVETNEEGAFSFPVTIPAAAGASLQKWPSYSTIHLQATVVDRRGEVQPSNLDLPIGRAALSVSSSLSATVCKERLKEELFRVYNANHQPLVVKGTYQLVAFPVSDTPFSSNSLLNDAFDQTKVSFVSLAKKEYDTLLRENRKVGVAQPFTTDAPLDLSAWKKIESGAYGLLLCFTDEAGEAHYYSARFLLYSQLDSKTPVKCRGWFKVLRAEYDATHPAALLFGTSENQVYVMCRVYSGKRLLTTSSFYLSNTVQRFDYPQTDESGQPIKVEFAFVRDGELYRMDASFSKSKRSKELKLKWKSFRDLLEPGQQETWTLQIMGINQEAQKAELMATMYDASLDQLAFHTWNFTLNRMVPYYPTIWKFSVGENARFWFHFPLQLQEMEQHLLRYQTPKTIDEYPFFSAYRQPGNVRMMARAGGIRIKGAASLSNEDIVAKEEMSRFSRIEDAAEEVISTTENGAQKQSKTATPPRSNYAETAFFYPHLRTDKKGEVEISFTLPEALTSWKVMLLAHTQEMEYGQLISKVVANKAFMVLPNIPRYVRAGDEVTISSAIMNRSLLVQKGKIRLELFDPATEKVVLCQKKSFEVKVAKTATVDFQFKVDGDLSLLAVRIVAETKQASDGEQHYLPVLSSKQWITEAVPFSSYQKGEISIATDTLFNHASQTATKRRLLVEVTANPLWSALQALPSLSTSTTNDVLSIAAAYYANTLASTIVTTYPRIERVFEQWEQKGGTHHASPLQLDNDLKKILVEESPWMVEADQEQTMRQLHTLFLDKNAMRAKNAVLVRQLVELQLSDGSWGWFQGMSGNLSITNRVIRLLLRLQQNDAAALSPSLVEALRRARSYVTNQLTERYALLTAADKEHITSLDAATMHYLYYNALDKTALSAADAALHASLLPLLLKVKQETIADKAIAAMVLFKAGKKKEAQALLLSIREYSVYTAHAGRYFERTKTVGRDLIATQTLVLEVMHQLAPDPQWEEQLKRWLLLQKRVQQWRSPLATVDAIAALLLEEDNRLQEMPLTLTYGKQQIHSDKDGVGSIKVTFTDNQILAKQPVVIQKENDGLAWGAVYAQFLEETSKIKASRGVLQMERQLLLLRADGALKKGVPILPGMVLHNGDKVVTRLTIHVAQDVDYVQLMDQRAACMEAEQPLSGTVHQPSVSYYKSMKDATTHYFFEQLKKGTYVIEESYFISRSGVYQSGIATLQSAYAPSFISVAPSILLKVNK